MEGTDESDRNIRTLYRRAHPSSCWTVFYRIRVRDSEMAAILLDALRLYSDLDACRHIDELDERLRIMDPNDPKTKELHKLREAWLKNPERDLSSRKHKCLVPPSTHVSNGPWKTRVSRRAIQAARSGDSVLISIVVKARG